MRRARSAGLLLLAISLGACGGSSSKTDGATPVDAAVQTDASAADLATPRDSAVTPDDGASPDGSSGPFGVTWTERPASPTASGNATFGFACDVSGCTFRCALDAAPLASCTSPVSFTGLAEGAHTMHLEATHATGVVTLTDDWIIDQTAPTLTSAVFDGYGTLALTFDEPVDATAAQDLTRYQLTPGLTVTSASAAGAVVSLGLSGYQLPIDYTLTASVRDPAGNQRTGITRTLAAASTGSRVAFLSKATGTGNLSQWTGAGGKTGLVAADSVCQTEAGAAGLTGTFRAYLSDSLNDAACRMRNLNGKVSASCGQGAPPPAGTSAWIGVDGQPVARNLGELIQGELLRPVALEADGTAVSAYRDAWHATDIAAATAGEVDGTTCTDWTSQTGTAFSNAAYQKVIPLRVWSSSACSSSIIGLLCFQVDAGGLPLNNRYRKIGKVAFLTSVATTGAISSGGKTGIAGADNLCQSLAGTAGLASPTSFVAWLSDNTTDAYCHVLGATGKRAGAPACGLAAPPATGPFVTSTGFPVADSLDDLTLNGPKTPIFATESGGFPTANVWTDTSNDGTVKDGTATCSDWTSTSGSTYLGQAVDETHWSLLGANSCSIAFPILCLQR